MPKKKPATLTPELERTERDCWNCVHLTNAGGTNWVQEFMCDAFNARFGPLTREFPQTNCPKWEIPLGKTFLTVNQ